MRALYPARNFRHQIRRTRKRRRGYPAAVGEPPVPASEDRSKWRYAEGGPPLEAAIQFVQVLKDPDIAARLNEVRELVTVSSWLAWRELLQHGLDRGFLTELHGHMPKVRFPADGMAYVFIPVTHPDQDEPIVFDKPQAVPMNVVTLLEERGVWRVHAVGGMVPPQDLGRTPYSW
jgi:hypothetical protein